MWKTSSEMVTHAEERDARNRQELLDKSIERQSPDEGHRQGLSNSSTARPLPQCAGHICRHPPKSGPSYQVIGIVRIHTVDFEC